MTLDRTGEPVDTSPHNCRKGWLTGANSDNPVPCPHCKKHLSGPTTSNNDSAERPPSARAQQAIERENHRNA